MSQGIFLVVTHLHPAFALTTLLSLLWHNLITPMGAHDNMNTDQKNIIECAKKDEELDVKDETILHSFFRSFEKTQRDKKKEVTKNPHLAALSFVNSVGGRRIYNPHPLWLLQVF